jgi:integrase
VKHADQWPATLTAHCSPVFGSLPVQAINTDMVLRVIAPLWDTIPETANRLRGRIEAVLDYAKARGLREGENSARWRGHLDKLLAPLASAKKAKRKRTGRGEHFAALHYSQMGDFMVALRGRGAIAARCLEFQILTAARPGEAIGAQWSEIDFEAKVWTVPEDRMKGGREHRVPLSDAAMAVLNGMRGLGSGELIFPGSVCCRDTEKGG